MLSRSCGLTALLVFLTCSLASAVAVGGYCYLENQLNHAGSKVLFQADSPGAVTDSTFTDSAGYYDIDLSQGVYDVYFTHDGYYGDEMLNRLFMNNTTLQGVTLTQIIQNELSGALNGILAVNTCRIVGDIFVQSGDSLFIQPGTVFQFDGLYSFDISGYISAVGTESDTIKFMLSPTATAWSGIQFSDSSDDSSILEYCSITASNSSGIFCSWASPTISRCSIIGNHYGYYWVDGGGIHLLGSDALIVNCIIAANSVGDSRFGGGIFCDGFSSPLIENCSITGNIIGSYGSGGGIACWEYSSPRILNCTVTFNSTDFVDGYGGGIYCITSSAIIDNCTIADNSTG